MALSGLSNFCGIDNQGGLISIEYAPTAWIDPATFEPLILNWNWQRDVDFTEGGWLLAYLTSDKQIWNEDQQPGRGQGKYYRQRVDGVAPNLIPAVAGEFDEMANYRYLLRLTDRDGRKWLLGTLESPFDFSTGATTGTSGQLKHHEVRWESETPHKAYGFVPVL